MVGKDIDLQFWPSTLEMEAMLPAPKAAAGPAKLSRTMRPMRKAGVPKLPMAAGQLVYLVTEKKAAVAQSPQYDAPALK